MKTKVLILGSGLVSKPIIRHLAANDKIDLTIASLYKKDIDAVSEGITNIRREIIDASNKDELKEKLEDKDIVVSLLPAQMHPLVARSALASGTHFVCTSYLSDRIKEINDEAVGKGLIFINECGMDPGLDHMSSMSLINSLKSRNYTITGYESYGSGIPAPDNNDNPWGYKFSWSPKGVITASQNEARFLKDENLIHLLPGTIFSKSWSVDVPGLYTLEAYPNRDALKYIELYGLHGIKTMIRATLRNPGWSKIWCSLYQLGIVNEIEFASAPPTYRRLFDFLTDFHYGTVSEEELIQALKKDYPLEAVEAISWLGLLDDKEIPYKFNNSVDILAALMSEKMVYKKNERDMVLLYHIIKAVSPEGREEKYVSQLTAFGTPDGETAMAKTVSLPSAIAVELIMDKEITSPGVHIPVEPEIYEPVLKGLKAIGIEVKETRME